LSQLVVSLSTGAFDVLFDRLWDAEHPLLDLRSEQTGDQSPSYVGHDVKGHQASPVSIWLDGEMASASVQVSGPRLIHVEQRGASEGTTLHDQMVSSAHDTLTMPNEDEPGAGSLAKETRLGNLRQHVGVA